jgi:UDP-N-acetylmuramate dehydrogenase
MSAQKDLNRGFDGGFDGASSLLEALADQPGLVLTEREELSRRTTFRIGGSAEIFAEVASEEALSALLAEVDLLDAPFFFLGLGSNVLVPDEGLPGVVAQLGGGFGRIDFDGVNVRAGGAASLSKLARAATSRGLLGLEALAGFPSTVGGAVRMNAGSYGSEICDVLTTVRVVDRRGQAATLAVEDLGAGYRTTRLQEVGQIVVEARFRLRRGDADAASARIAELNRKRWQSLPSGSAHAGSVFRNPVSSSAGKLIDECGLKGISVGGAQISPKHGNVIVNTGSGRAADVLELMVRAYEAVASEFNVLLEPEVVLAGSLQQEWNQRTLQVRARVEDSIGDGRRDE